MQAQPPAPPAASARQRRHNADVVTADIAPVTHRKPARMFQVVGVFVLVLGAVAGVYLGVNHLHKATASSLAINASPLTPLADDVVEQKTLARLLAKQKAEAAAAAEAERARKANELAQRNAQEAASRSQRTTGAPAVPTSCNDYTGNRALGCALLLQAGFGLDQMGCLDALWTRESGWNERSQNASSGAYGIPQALPGSKMAVYGSDWQTNPVPQIKWGLNYIAGRYSTPCGAWSHWQANNWY